MHVEHAAAHRMDQVSIKSCATWATDGDWAIRPDAMAPRPLQRPAPWSGWPGRTPIRLIGSEPD